MTDETSEPNESDDRASGAPPELPEVPEATIDAPGPAEGSATVPAEDAEGKPPTPPVSDSDRPLRDARGERWNPNRHSSPPTKTKSGYWSRKAGRKPGSSRGGPAAESPRPEGTSEGPPAPGAAPLAPAGPGTPDNDARADMLAAAMVSTLATVGQTVAGPAGKPYASEREGMLEGWKTYLRSVDCSQVPPWAAAVLGTAPYLVRLSSEQTIKSKFARKPKADATPKADPMPATIERAQRPATSPFDGID